MPMDYEGHIISFGGAKPQNFNSQFWKYVTPQFDQLFMPGGIFQFYPNYISFKENKMEVRTSRAMFVLPRYEPADYHAYFTTMSRGACI